MAIKTNFIAPSISSNSYSYFNGESPGYVYSLDDISSLFDSLTKTFSLTINGGTAISPNSPNHLDIFVGGVKVFPATYINDYFNHPYVDVFNEGFTVSGSTITFATAPSKPMDFYGTVRTTKDPAPTFRFYTTPFKPINIMLGS